MAKLCGILHERSEDEGDNGGCDRPFHFRCMGCGLEVCEWHTFAVGEKNLCAVCYGVAGFERKTAVNGG